MGGQFYDYVKRVWTLEKPLGVVAVSKQSGQAVWTYDKAKDGITNMLLLDGQNTLLISDNQNLIDMLRRPAITVPHSLWPSRCPSRD